MNISLLQHACAASTQVRPHPHRDNTKPVRSAASFEGTSAKGGVDVAGVRQSVASKHSYTQRLPNAPPDARLAPTTLKPNSIDRVLRNMYGAYSTGGGGGGGGHEGATEMSLSMGGDSSLTFLATSGESDALLGTTERVAKTTQLGEILKSAQRQKEETLFYSSPDAAPASESAPAAPNARHEAAATMKCMAAQDTAPSFYPLQFFDDSTFETRSMEEWMTQVSEGHVDAASLWHLLDGSAVWNACDVLECNSKDETYLIQWRSNSKTKWVSRLNVCFGPFETPDELMVRRQQALDNRMRAEAILSFERKIDALPGSSVAALAPEHFHRIVSRIGMPNVKEMVAQRQPLVQEVVGQYSRSMALIKHHRTFPEEDPALQTLDPVEERGLAALPIVMLKIPGHAAYSMVPLEEGFREDDQIEANEVRKKEFRMTVGAVESALCWHPPCLCKALALMRGHIQMLEKRSLFWNMASTVTVQDFVSNHRRAAKDTVTFLMTTVMDLMSDALLTAFSEEEDLLPAGTPLVGKEREKYTQMATLMNRVLRCASA